MIAGEKIVIKLILIELTTRLTNCKCYTLISNFKIITTKNVRSIRHWVNPFSRWRIIVFTRLRRAPAACFCVTVRYSQSWREPWSKGEANGIQLYHGASPPDSINRTRFSGLALKRSARTHPAVPAPTENFKKKITNDLVGLKLLQQLHREQTYRQWNRTAYPVRLRNAAGPWGGRSGAPRTRSTRPKQPLK